MNPDPIRIEEKLKCGGQDLNKASLEEALSRTLDITIIPFLFKNH